MAFTKSDAIASALFHALIDAPDADAEVLFAALKDFRDTRSASYRGVRNQPFADRLVNAIEEAAAYRNSAFASNL